VNKNYKAYLDYKKPSWAPPAKLFAPVWTFLYIIIFISFGFVFYKAAVREMLVAVALPFSFNLVFNIAYTPIQFGLKNYILASADIILILITLVWAMYIVFPFAPWVALVNIPYLLWVSFATVLQLTVTKMNLKI
jgi:benzodiazapine receptor